MQLNEYDVITLPEQLDGQLLHGARLETANIEQQAAVIDMAYDQFAMN